MPSPLYCLSRPSNSAPKGSSASRAALATARSPGSSSAPAACPPAPTRPRRRRSASAWCARSGATASGSSSSARSGATTWRATAGSRAWPSAWACRASPRATCTRTIRRGRRSRTRWWRSGWAASLDETGALRRGNWRSALRAAGRDGAALRRLSRRGGGVRAPGRAPSLQPPLRSRLPLPGRRGRGRRPRAGRAVRGALRGALRRHARAQGGEAAPGGRAAGDPQAAPVGLLHASTPTCWSWRGRWRARCAGPSRRAESCRRGAGAAPA